MIKGDITLMVLIYLFHLNGLIIETIKKFNSDASAKLVKQTSSKHSFACSLIKSNELHNRDTDPKSINTPPFFSNTLYFF
jgi:hypothetical protein